MTETTIGKLLTSFGAALIMYWAYVPAPVEVLLVMMLLDLLIGSMRAWFAGKFRAGVLFRGFMKKAMVIPVLAACHLTEEAIGLQFHLEVFFANGLTAWEFISIVETYIQAGGRGGQLLQRFVDRARASIAQAVTEQRPMPKPQPLQPEDRP